MYTPCLKTKFNISLSSIWWSTHFKENVKVVHIVFITHVFLAFFIKAVFSSLAKKFRDTVALSFVYNNYCPTID